MDTFKITTWNVEHADKTLKGLDSANASTRRNAERKIKAIRDEISEIDPDILFLCEGPKGEERAERYFAEAAPGYELVRRGDPEGKSYGVQGTQWLWFLHKKNFPFKMDLLPVKTWQAFTEEESAGRSENGRWYASLPQFNRNSRKVLPAKLDRHGHYRHPQVAFFEYKGKRIEPVGVHLKGKFVNQRHPALRWKKPASEKFQDIRKAIEASPGYVTESAKARAKLSSEASDIRNYIERRFSQEKDPAILLMGDVNDGPGKELFEDWFLLHDLIGNLQGDVFFARRFLNHALFDLPDHLRWSVEFADQVTPHRSPFILLDHILLTQPMSGRDACPLRVMPHAGRVEHDIHERINSLLPDGVTTSDHRPVSVVLTESVPD